MAVPVLDELLQDIALPIFDFDEGMVIEELVTEEKRDTIPCPPPPFDEELSAD